MSFFAKMLSVFVASTNPPAVNYSNVVMVDTNVPVATAAATVPATNSLTPAAEPPAPTDPVEQEYQKLLTADDDAHTEVDKWIRENQEFRSAGGGVPDDELNRRIRERLGVVEQSYKNFIAVHTNHAAANLAFASFLDGIGREEESLPYLERSRDLDPKNPASWNNLANYHGHFGGVKKSFEYYAKAIELNPYESVYYHNFGTTVYLFRKDAMEYFEITEQQVFDKALELYARAMDLDPDNFPLAADVAQTYYGIKPFRGEDALTAWTNAMKIAHDDAERQGVQLHFARMKLTLKRYAEVQAHLDAVSLPQYDELKKRLTRNLIFAKEKPAGTNAPPASGSATGAATAAEPPVVPGKLWKTNELPRNIYRLK